MMELPADVEKNESDPGHASIWQTELWKAFKGVTGMRMVSFNMGDYGHRAKRPTTAATNYPLLYGLGDASPSTGVYIPSSLLSKKEMGRWPRHLKDLVLQAIEEGLDGSFAEEEELMKAGLRVSKLTKDQKMEWKQHLLNDHQPYRTDCAVCINAQAYGYQHRRRKMPGLYTVALDLAGPFKQKGRDTEFDDYKYVMVAAYRCPRDYMNASSIPEYDREIYVPDEPEDLEDDVMETEMDEDHKELTTEEEESDKEEYGPETLEEAVGEMKQAEETATIYVTRPLRRRATPHVLQAAKEIVLQLRQSGLHVDVVHTDRAREFKARTFQGVGGRRQPTPYKNGGRRPSGHCHGRVGSEVG